MKVRVTFEYEPDPDQVDEEDPTGLTEDAFTSVNDNLSMQFGAERVEAEAVVE